jgi:glycosyltransferase involved in cell wall biosynthesis
MRILAISMSARVHAVGGMEDHLHTLMEGLVRRGHDVTAITARHPEGIVDEVVAGVRWLYVDSGPSWLDPAWDQATVAASRRLLQEESFDVIHSQSSSALALMRAGIPDLPPVVLSLHGQYLSIVKASLLTIVGRPTPRTVARSTLDLARKSRMHFRQGHWRRFRGCETTVPSQSQRTPSRLALMLEKDAVHVVRNGIDTDLFRPGDMDDARVASGLPPAIPIALCAGRLDRGKGIYLAINALAQLNGFPDAQLVLVGDEGPQAHLSRLADRLGVAERVIFAGPQTLDRVAVLMRASDVVVYPSLLGEAGPLVVAQAMACGRPVLASNRGAIPEMLGRDGQAGIVVQAGRVRPLARGLERLFADPALRMRMGKHGRAVATREMTIERMIDETYAVYEIAVRRRQQGKH